MLVLVLVIVKELFYFALIISVPKDSFDYKLQKFWELNNTHAGQEPRLQYKVNRLTSDTWLQDILD